MSQQSQEEEDYLPATQQSADQADAVGSLDTFLWTKEWARSKHVLADDDVCDEDRGSDRDSSQSSNSIDERSNYDEKDGQLLDESCDFATSTRASQRLRQRSATPTLEETHEPIEPEQAKSDRHPYPDTLQTRPHPPQVPQVRDKEPAEHATPVPSWKVSRFSSRSQPAPAKFFALRSQESAEEIEDDDVQPVPPPSTALPSRSWRIPLQARADDAAQRRHNVDHADAREVDVQLGLQGFNEEEEQLSGLHDINDAESEEDDDVSMDLAELQDFLKYRLLTGLKELDKRLGIEAQHASFLCENDSLGLRNGGILEVAGTPGSGKTTLLVQLALQERISALLQAAASVVADASSGCVDEGADDDIEANAAREVVIIDTEGSISAERLHSMAVALVTRAKGVSVPADVSNLVEHTLAGIYVVRCTDMAEFLATLETLLPSCDYPDARTEAERQVYDRFMEAWDDMQMPQFTSLIVIDSISHLFRSTPSDDAAARRTRQHAFACVRTFCANVHSWGIKLIVSNQLSSVFVTSQGQRTRMTDSRGTAYMRPTMRQWLDERTESEAWRVMLYFGDPLDEERRVKIVARPSSVNEIAYLDEGYWSTPVAFCIDAEGIVEDVNDTAT